MWHVTGSVASLIVAMLRKDYYNSWLMRVMKVHEQTHVIDLCRDCKDD